MCLCVCAGAAWICVSAGEETDERAAVREKPKEQQHEMRRNAHTHAWSIERGRDRQTLATPVSLCVCVQGERLDEGKKKRRGGAARAHAHTRWSGRRERHTT